MTPPLITDIHARRIWDSRGRPTVEAEVILSDGTKGRGIAPAGASRGRREALDRRDGGEHLGGLDVQGAITSIRDEILDALKNVDPFDQAGADARLIELDPSPTKARIGGNATTAVSLAILWAAAKSRHLPLWRFLAQDRTPHLPLPEIQIFGGGAHADRRIDVQDFMVMALAAQSFSQALEMTAEVYQATGRIMRERGRLGGVADEGGWWPAFKTNEEALDTLMQAIERAGFVPGEEIAISLDVAASELYSNGMYRLGLEGRELDTDGLAELLLRWCDHYPIVSVEDPFAEDDHSGMAYFTAAIGRRVQVVGDDYLVTNADLVETAARDKAVNAVLIKVNQAGTVTEAKAAFRAAKQAGFATIISARSGETEDVTIAHLAVGWDAGQIKVGSFARAERMAKWNEVLRIEESLGSEASLLLRNFHRNLVM